MLLICKEPFLLSLIFSEIFTNMSLFWALPYYPLRPMFFPYFVEQFRTFSALRLSLTFFYHVSRNGDDSSSSFRDSDKQVPSSDQYAVPWSSSAALKLVDRFSYFFLQCISFVMFNYCAQSLEHFAARLEWLRSLYTILRSSGAFPSKIMNFSTPPWQILLNYGSSSFVGCPSMICKVLSSFVKQFLSKHKMCSSFRQFGALHRWPPISQRWLNRFQLSLAP